MLKYLMAPEVHVCVADGSAILLDLRRDKYLGLGPAETATLGELVEGWPCPSVSSEIAAKASDVSSAALELASDMQRRGLLTMEPSTGRPAAPIQLTTPAGSVVHQEGPGFTKRDVVDFAVACSIASCLLRWGSMHGIASRLNRRKLRSAKVTPGEDPRSLAVKFVSMRPLLFGAKDECLFDSIALLEFLWRRQTNATWVLGVKVGPFSSHSWVQHEDVVLNDTMENALSFTPIFAV